VVEHGGGADLRGAAAEEEVIEGVLEVADALNSRSGNSRVSCDILIGGSDGNVFDHVRAHVDAVHAREGEGGFARPLVRVRSQLNSTVMKDTAALLDQVLSLPENDRAEMATRILESLDPEAQLDVDEASAVEIERRCAAVDAGTLTTSDWKDVRARIERDIFGR
jgi:putative addiction module component (TIGR02574 family)